MENENNHQTFRPNNHPVNINIYKTVVAPSEIEGRTIPRLSDSNAGFLEEVLKIGAVVTAGVIGVAGASMLIENSNNKKLENLDKLLTSDDNTKCIGIGSDEQDINNIDKKGEIVSALVDYSTSDNYAHYKIQSNEWDTIFFDINEIDKDFLIIEDSDDWAKENKIPIFIFSKNNIFSQLKLIKGEKYTISNLKETAPFLDEILTSLDFENNDKFILKLVIEIESSDGEFKSKFVRDGGLVNNDVFMCYYGNKVLTFKQN